MEIQNVKYFLKYQETFNKTRYLISGEIHQLIALLL